MKKISNLILCIEKYCQIIKPLLDKYENSISFQGLRLFINISFLKRFYYNFLTIKNLLGLYKDDHNYKFPLGILLRTGLSDFLTYFYFILLEKQSNINSEQFRKECLKFLSGQLYYAKKEIELNLSQGKINSTHYHLLLENLYNIFPDFIDSTTGELIENKYMTISQIRKELEKDDELKYAAEAYKAYDIFSKYEHVGALTFGLDDSQITKIDFDISGIISSTIFMAWGIETIIMTFPEYNNLKASLNLIIKDLRKL